MEQLIITYMCDFLFYQKIVYRGGAYHVQTAWSPWYLIYLSITVSISSCIFVSSLGDKPQYFIYVLCTWKHSGTLCTGSHTTYCPECATNDDVIAIQEHMQIQVSTPLISCHVNNTITRVVDQTKILSPDRGLVQSGLDQTKWSPNLMKK